MSVGMSVPSFKGVYKITMPNVNTISDKKEKEAVSEMAINTIVMGANSSIEAPRVNKDDSSIYFKINDKDDKNFEKGFNEILEYCNKNFNTDLAKKVYMQKVSEAEFRKAEPLE